MPADWLKPRERVYPQKSGPVRLDDLHILENVSLENRGNLPVEPVWP
jgi:hypothetical protein